MARVRSLLVLDSVTSTPQLIRQPKPRAARMLLDVLEGERNVAHCSIQRCCLFSRFDFGDRLSGFLF